MADPKLKLGNDIWATKQKSLLAYNDEGGNFKSLPFQVDRISGGTYVGRNGLIQTAASNEPRIDFTSNTKGGLLLEPQRTNQFTNSENLANIDFQNFSTVTTDNIIAPSGSLTADKTTQTSGGYLRETVSVSNGTTYSFSVFLKKGNLRYAVVRSLFSQNGVTTANSNNVFDLDNGGVEYKGTDIVSASIEPYANDWYRCSFVSLASSTGSAPFIDFYFSSSNSSTQSSGTSGFGYGWGMQLEAGTYSTSIIPTSGAAVTRVKDEVANGGNEFIFNDSEGVVFMDVEIPENSSEVKQSALCNGTTNEAVKILQLNSTTFRFEVVMSSGTNFSQDITVNPYQRNKLALQYKANEYKVFVNGIKQTVTQRSTLPSGLDVYNFNRGFSTSDNFSGLINALKVFNTSLSDSELATLTTL